MDLVGRETGVEKNCSRNNSSILDVVVVDSQGCLGNIQGDLFFLPMAGEQRESCYALDVVGEDNHPRSFGGLGFKEHLSFLQSSCCKRSMEANNCNKLMDKCHPMKMYHTASHSRLDMNYRQEETKSFYHLEGDHAKF